MSTEHPADMPPAPEDRVVWALRRAELAVQAVKEQRLRPLGMTTPHYMLLASLHAEPGLSGAELARRLSVTPQAVASLVARLEDRGLVVRRAHPRHRHVRELHLTDAGRGSLAEADAEVDAIEQEIRTALGPDSERVLALLAVVASTAWDSRTQRSERSG